MRKKIIILAGIISVLLLGGCASKPVVNNSIATSQTVTTPVSNITTIDTYMEKNNITLKAKDVQFDMANNLDKNFAIQGTAKLDDYYNYGFINNKDYFCINVSTDDTYSNSWYLYCDRESYSKLFDDLQSGDKDITATCIVSSAVYKSKQGNMAKVLNIEW